jgi:hypothetical protein
MVQKKAADLAGRKILIIGTAFTASQGLYSEILRRAAPRASINTIAATDLERKIARFEPWEGPGDKSLTPDLRQAIKNTDVVFLDPGAWCPDLVKEETPAKYQKLSLEVTGTAVSEERMIEYASSYLEVGSVSSMVSQGSQ